MVYLIKPQSFVKLFVDCLIHMVKTLKSANINPAAARGRITAVQGIIRNRIELERRVMTHHDAD
jgi:hypothetical protein